MSSDPSKRLKILQKRLEDMFQLLSLWTQYVEVIYMPESEIHVLSAIERMEARPEDTAYGFRAQENDIRSRINTLFAQDKPEQVAEEAQEHEEYETVNEGMTTDTTEASAAVRRGESEASETAPSEKAPAIEEEGILSSDDEEKVTKQSKVIKPLSQTSQQEINSFVSDKPTGLFESHKVREQVENKFNFGEQDLDLFGQKLETRADREPADKKKIVDDEEEAAERSYIDCKIVFIN